MFLLQQNGTHKETDPLALETRETHQPEYARYMKSNTIAEQEPNPNKKFFSIDVTRMATEWTGSKGISDGVHLIVVGSETSNHVVWDQDLLIILQQVPKAPVKLPSGSRRDSNRHGMLYLQVDQERMTLTNVYYIPDINLNIMSCSRLAEKGVTTTVNNVTCD